MRPLTLSTPPPAPSVPWSVAADGVNPDVVLTCTSVQAKSRSGPAPASSPSHATARLAGPSTTTGVSGIAGARPLDSTTVIVPSPWTPTRMRTLPLGSTTVVPAEVVVMDGIGTSTDPPSGATPATAPVTATPPGPTVTVPAGPVSCTPSTVPLTGSVVPAGCQLPVAGFQTSGAE